MRNRSFPSRNQRVSFVNVEEARRETRGKKAVQGGHDDTHAIADRGDGREGRALKLASTPSVVDEVVGDQPGPVKSRLSERDFGQAPGKLGRVLLNQLVRDKVSQRAD